MSESGLWFGDELADVNRNWLNCYTETFHRALLHIGMDRYDLALAFKPSRLALAIHYQSIDPFGGFGGERLLLGLAILYGYCLLFHDSVTFPLSYRVLDTTNNFSDSVQSRYEFRIDRYRKYRRVSQPVLVPTELQRIQLVQLVQPRTKCGFHGFVYCISISSYPVSVQRLSQIATSSQRSDQLIIVGRLLPECTFQDIEDM